MKKHVAVVVPHPDDFDILVNHAVQYFISHGFKVFEILMTGGEYGVVNRGFEDTRHLKGLKLRAIRRKENDESKRAYDVLTKNPPAVRTIYMNYVDGYLPVNQKSVRVLAKKLAEIDPAVIIGPDPIYAIDWHHDHIATGLNTLFAVRLLKKKKILSDYVQYFMFQTFKPNRFFPLGSWDVYRKSLLAHRSQLTPLGITLMMGFQKSILYPARGCRYGLRLISDPNNPGNLDTVWDRAVASLFRGNRFVAPQEDVYKPPPEKLGLKVDPFGEEDIFPD